MAAEIQSSRESDPAKEASMENEHGQSTAPAPAAEVKPKEPSKLKQLWTKTGLDVPTLLMMGKAALPPTIAIAIYQSTEVADTFSTLGYLVAIAATLGFCIMPRAKFAQTMLINILTICIASAVQMLALWSVMQARLNTTPVGGSPLAYNSSASAVAAIWLFAQIYVINSFKSARPQFQFPVVLASIFINIASIYGPILPTFAYMEAFIRRLLISFLTGFGLATGVSFFIVPVSTRMVVFKEMDAYLGGLRGVLKAQTAYMSSLQNEDMFRGNVQQNESKKHSGHADKSSKNPPTTQPTPQAAKLKAAVTGLQALHGKLNGDLTFAKRETAWGKLNGSDINEIFRLFRRLLLPVAGLTTIIDIFERVAEIQGFNRTIATFTEGIDHGHDDIDEEYEQEKVREWQAIMKTLHDPFDEITEAMDQALEHVLLSLEFKKAPKKKAGNPSADDVESRGADPKPGTREFAEYYDRKTTAFYESKQTTLKIWCEQKGIQIPDDFFDSGYQMPETLGSRNETKYHEYQRQLFIVLYMEHLLWAASRALFDLVRFAELKIASGAMKKNRLIAPGWKRVKKWAISVFKAEGGTQGNHDINVENSAVDFGDSFHARKDPEHLPAVGVWEKLGNGIRVLPRLLRSEHSAFGFRVACATMSIAIVAYLEATQSFFNQQRLVWAMIMVALSMTRTAGQSLFNFLLRILGTAVAMVASFVIWYIVDGHTAGVIVFLWIWISCAFYLVIKMPKFLVVGLISAVTAVLIIGYELQVRKIGVAAATASGQLFYPVYELAPYRLATVAGGLGIAYIWTIFPYPITEHSELRRELGSALFLAANFYSVTHETVASRIRGDEGNVNLKGSPGYQLEKIRSELFATEMGIISRLKVYSAFEKWQLSLGGKFPKAIYDKIIRRVETILFYSALIGYASAAYQDEESEWNRDFKQLLKTIAVTAHDITSTLSLLSSAVSDGRPLPPYLRLPEPFRLVKDLESLDRDILSIRHISEPGYAAFAVIHIASQTIVTDLHRLAEDVQELVGTLDFSYHFVAKDTDSQASSNGDVDTDSGKNKQS